MTPRKLWRSQRLLKRRRRDAATGFDMPRLLRTGILALCVCGGMAIGIEAVLSGIDGVVPFDIRQLTSITSIVAIAGLLSSMAYSGYFIFLRLQCSLLEMTLMIAVIGAMEGLLFTTPGMTEIPHITFVIAVAMPAIVVEATMEALFEIQLLGVEKPWPRLLVLLADWASVFGVASLIGGGFLALGISNSWSTSAISRNGIFMALAGLLIAIPGAIIGYRAGKAAERILQEEAFLKQVDI